ncbi:hypothetical protein OUZ56_005272 [Daphnia magna]|uniref:Uncharacterized protein n=1 Tax=Daphnia magna TaxID=35525 RepID=A0ABQ9YSC4_9CRUS|nr:hypothetical protein OUZ56_005272 [Daphnia magna]
MDQKNSVDFNLRKNIDLSLYHFGALSVSLTRQDFGNYNEEGIVSLHQGTERLNIQNSVPIWATFGSSVPNVVQEIDGRINTNSYIGFLQTFVYPTAMDQFSNMSGLEILETTCRLKKSGELLLLKLMNSDEVNEEFVSQELKAFPTKLNDVVKNSGDWISE